jgi:hypothetical protein
METQVETVETTNGATLELATIIYNGNEYTAQGALIDTERGLAVAYVSDDGTLTDWEGNQIGRYHVISSYKRFAFYGPYTMECIRATLNADPSRMYYGRYNTEYQAVTIRRLAH